MAKPLFPRVIEDNPLLYRTDVDLRQLIEPENRSQICKLCMNSCPQIVDAEDHEDYEDLGRQYGSNVSSNKYLYPTTMVALNNPSMQLQMYKIKERQNNDLNPYTSRISLTKN
jgi:hypothetical protein